MISHIATARTIINLNTDVLLRTINDNKVETWLPSKASNCNKERCF